MLALQVTDEPYIFETNLTPIFDILSIFELLNGTNGSVELLPFPNFHSIMPAILANPFSSTNNSFGPLCASIESCDSDAKEITTSS